MKVASDFEGILVDQRRSNDGKLTTLAHIGEARVPFKRANDKKIYVLRATDKLGRWVSRTDLLGSSERALSIGESLGFSEPLTPDRIPYGLGYEMACKIQKKADLRKGSACTVKSKEQTCTRCGLEWVCKRTPLEKHDLCNSCAQQSSSAANQSSSSSSWSRSSSFPKPEKTKKPVKFSKSTQKVEKKRKTKKKSKSYDIARSSDEDTEEFDDSEDNEFTAQARYNARKQKELVHQSQFDHNLDWGDPEVEVGVPTSGFEDQDLLVHQPTLVETDASIRGTGVHCRVGGLPEETLAYAFGTTETPARFSIKTGSQASSDIRNIADASSSSSVSLFDNVNPLSARQRAALPVPHFADEETTHYRDIVNPANEVPWSRMGNADVEYRGPYPFGCAHRRLYSEVRRARKPRNYLPGRSAVSIASTMCKGSSGAPATVYNRGVDSDTDVPALMFDSSDSDSDATPALVSDSGSDLSSDHDLPEVSVYNPLDSSEDEDQNGPSMSGLTTSSASRLPNTGMTKKPTSSSRLPKRTHTRGDSSQPESEVSSSCDTEGQPLLLSGSGSSDDDVSPDDVSPYAIARAKRRDPEPTETVPLTDEDRAMLDQQARVAELNRVAQSRAARGIKPRHRVDALTQLPCKPRVKLTRAAKKELKAQKALKDQQDKQFLDHQFEALTPEAKADYLATAAYNAEFDRQRVDRAYLTWKVTQSVQFFTKQGCDDKELTLHLERRIDALCLEAFKFGDNKMSESDAVTWGDGFLFPPDAVQADEKALSDVNYDFDQLVKDRLQKISAVRMSVESVNKICTPGNPDRELLVELAADGMDLCLPDDYEPNNPLPDGQGPCDSLSSSYKITYNAVDKMIYDNFYAKGLAIVLSADTAVEHVKNFSTAVARWAPKAQKVQGRPIHDATAKAKGQKSVLNSKESAEACKLKYGTIINPTLQSVVCMIFEFWEREKKANPNARWEDLELWKMDLAGAFTLLSFQAALVRNVALALWGHLIVFFLCGVFGWTGTPGCFQVINRTLMYEAAKLLRGLAQMFCDDVMGVSFSKDVDHDQAVMSDMIIALFCDEDAVAQHKTERGRKLVILGFNVDLDTLVASIDNKNLYNAIYSFMEIREHEIVAFKQMERLASLASRYGTINVHMNPMVRILYREMKGKHRGRQWRLSNNAKVAVWFFRAMLIATNVCDTEFCRPLWSMRNLKSWLYIAEFDACLTGIGCVWYILTPHGKEIAVGAASWDISSMGFEEAAYQNTCEFMGAIMCLVGLIRYEVASKPFLLRGDSKSALSWADRRRYRGDLATPAGFVFNYIWVTWQVLLSKCVHLPGVDNNACDDLSRELCGKHMDEFRKAGALDAQKDPANRRYSANMTEVGDRSECVELETFMGLCNPNQTWETEEQFSEFWGKMVGWCELVLGEAPPPWSPHPEDHA